VDDPTKSRRLSQLPCPGTDGTFATPTPTRREGELWCHPIAGTEDASSKLTSLTSQGYEETGAAAACDGLGAGDAISAGSAGSAERGCLRLGLSCCCSSCSSRRGSIALWRDREEDRRDRPTSTNRRRARPVFRLRGGEAPTKVSGTAGASAWNMNMDIFGWGQDSESKEELKQKRLQEMEEAEAREELRKGREDRLERELEETGV
ncbi:unnamed protein product, partial [Laminaria digitata]